MTVLLMTNINIIIITSNSITAAAVNSCLFVFSNLYLYRQVLFESVHLLYRIQCCVIDTSDSSDDNIVRVCV